MNSQDNDSRRSKLSADKRAALEARLKGKGRKNGSAAAVRIPRRAGEGPAPLSLAQERLWVLNQLEPDSTAYNVPSAFRIRGVLDVDALRAALGDLTARHDVLRTTFRSEGERQYQDVADKLTLDMPVHDLSAVQDVEASAGRLLAQQAAELFSLADGPLFRSSLIKLAPEEHLLAVMAHHSVTDGWSLGVILRDITRAYAARVQGQVPDMPPLPVQYGDYAQWQRDWLEGEELDRQIDYWKGCLGGELPVLQLPLDKPRPPIRSHHGALERIELPSELIESLEQLARAEGATLFMVLIAAYDVLLYRYSGQEDIVVGTPIANRTRTETEAMVGFFANTLAMRADLSGAPTFRELIGRVKNAALEAYDHQDIPFQRLVEVIQPARDMSRTPVYQTLFSFMDKTMNVELSAAGATFSRTRIEADIAQTDLVLYLEEQEQGVLCAAEYGTDLFEAGTIARMLENYSVLLRSIVAQPDARIADLPLLSDTERSLVLDTWNDTDCEYERERCVHQLFESQVERTGDLPALCFEAETLSYRELNARANQLAHRLIELGVGPESLVGLCMFRNTDLIVGLLGILKAGGAYVPLDPNYPHDRLVYMIEDSGAAVIVTDRAGRELLGVSGVEYVEMDTQRAALDALPTDNPDSGVTCDNLAYVIYTSGSTGKPKGVMVMHRNVSNFFTGMDQRILHTPEQLDGQQGVWLAVTSISFDISVLEIFWSLARGFKLVVYGADDRKSAAVQASKSATRTQHADKHIDFSLFYFASDEGEFGANKYRLLLEGAKFADRNDFKAMWTPERHFHPFGGLFPSPAVASAAIAVLTERIAIRCGSVVVPLDNPIRIAEEWQLVDNLSNGRVGMSFASGWQPNDFVLAPDNYESRREVMYDGLDKIRRLWRGERLTMDGGDGKPFEFGTLPRPVQSELPFWVTAAGDPKTFAAAGKLGANMLTHLLGQTVDELAEKLAIYRKARAEAGHEGPGTVSLMLHTFIGEDEAEVRRVVEGPFKDYLRGSVGLFKPFAQAMGLDFNDLSEEDLEALIDHAFERYYVDNSLFGTVATGIAMVDRLKVAGVDEIACLIDFGIPSDTVLQSLRHVNDLRIATMAHEDAQAGDGEDYSVPGLIKMHGATHLQCTPSMASMMVADADERTALAGLKQWMVGGEAFPVELAQDLREVLGDSAVITNMYGPTETTIWSTTHELGGDDGAGVSIGKPIANTDIYILDVQGRPVPVGVAGELIIGGDGVVRGYHNRQDLTDERFVPDPFSGGEARMYRTGDLVRYDSDGKIEFLGRNDFQVKIRGYRIELGEIESRMLQHPSVKEAVVVLREDTAGDKRLVGYVTPAPGQDVDIDSLRGHLREALTDYMVPAAFVVLDELPLTPNKKIDRKALPAPEGGSGVAVTEFVSPGNPLEEQIAAIWEAVLRVPKVGVHDNFFDLGGHSLLIVHVLNRLRAEGQKLAMTDLFRFPTIAGLAGFLLQGRDENSAAASAGSSRAAQRRAQRGGAAVDQQAPTRRRRR